MQYYTMLHTPGAKYYRIHIDYMCRAQVLSLVGQEVIRLETGEQ